MLKEYKKKRDFEITPEPSGESSPKTRSSSRKALSFVIQKHSASHLHYDFRLEIAGVMVSWAVPKGPCLDPSVKRLAMMTEDHPMEYSSFEGIIPEKQYGAGEVIIWDNGTYSPDEDGELIWRDKAHANERMAAALKKGKLSFTMKGKKVKGSWTLVRMHKTEKQWLLIKHRDEFADTTVDITRMDSSVVSGLTLVDLQEGKATKVWTKSGAQKIESEEGSLKGRKRKIVLDTLSVSPSDSQKKGKALSALLNGLPSEKNASRKAPMLATLADEPFSLDGWLFEPKLDGIRAIAVLKDGSVELSSRRGVDLSPKYPHLVAELEQIKHNLVLDGEIVALDERGRPSFQQLQQSSGNLREFSKSRSSKLYYYVFDILHCDGRKLTDLALEKRKEILSLALLNSGKFVKPVGAMGSDGAIAFQVCIESGLEGVVGKRASSLYESGRRSREWLKFKSNQSSEFIICGFSEGTGSRAKTFGSLVLGEYNEKRELVYVGNVGTGFNDKSLRGLLSLLKPLVETKCPLKSCKGVKATWVKPQLVAEVKYMERTRDNMLRVPVFLRLRDDVEASTVQETPILHASVASRELKLVKKEMKPRRKA